MNRRDFLKTAIVSGATLSVGSCATLKTSTAPGPNIVVIVVDDLGYADMSFKGMAPDVKTPNIDALARRSVRFSNAYVTAPICNASRISLMTGRYQQRQGQYWYEGPGLADPKYNTIAEALKSQGYATGYIGKFHHGASDSLTKRGFPLNHGFDYFYGFEGGTKHYLRHSRKLQKENGKLHQGPMWVQRKQVDVEGFTTELFGKEARQFIKKNKSNRFYLHLSFNAVHNFTHQLPESYLKDKALKGFPDFDPSKDDYWAWRKKLGYPAHRQGRQYYLGQLSFLDREIGLLIQELKDQEIQQNTAIIFVSDNGGSLVTYANNGNLKGGKYTLFEGGIRVPMFVSLPSRFRSDVVVDPVVTTMDLFPTICALAGAGVPQDLDGSDLTAVLSRNVGSMDERYVFWDTNAENAVRKGRWKLLITKSTPNKRLQIVDSPKGRFLYDLENDPGETRNVSAQNPNVVNKLANALKKWQTTVKKQIAHKPKPERDHYE